MKRKLQVLSILILSVFFIGATTPTQSLYYPSYKADDHGSVERCKTIKAYVDAIGASEKGRLVFRHFPINGNETRYLLTTAESIPRNIDVEFEKGAYIELQANLAIAGNIFAGNIQKCFYCNGGTLTYQGSSPFQASWTGVSDAETAANNGDFLIDAYNAVAGDGRQLILDIYGTVPYDTTLDITADNVVIDGKNWKTQLDYQGNSDAIRINEGADYEKIKIINIRLKTSSGTPTSGINIGQDGTAAVCDLENVEISGFDQYGAAGILATYAVDCYFKNVLLLQNYDGYRSEGTSTTCTFEDVKFHSNDRYGYYGKTGEKVTFKGNCIAENNGLNGMVLRPESTSIKRPNIDCWFEGNNKYERLWCYSGSTEPTVDETITGNSSSHTCTLRRVDLITGDWSGGTAVAELYVEAANGTFTHDEQLNGSTSGNNFAQSWGTIIPGEQCLISGCYAVPFDSGGDFGGGPDRPVIGEIISSASGGSGTLMYWAETTGSWYNGTMEGVLYLKDYSGTFADDDQLDGSVTGVNIATQDGSASLKRVFNPIIQGCNFESNGNQEEDYNIRLAHTDGANIFGNYFYTNQADLADVCLESSNTNPIIIGNDQYSTWKDEDGNILYGMREGVCHLYSTARRGFNSNFMGTDADFDQFVGEMRWAGKIANASKATVFSDALGGWGILFVWAEYLDIYYVGFVRLDGANTNESELISREATPLVHIRNADPDGSVSGAGEIEIGIYASGSTALVEIWNDLGDEYLFKAVLLR